MTKTKNPTQSIELRLSVNLSLDDVGLTRLYQELRDIELSASGLASIQVHALKRRHLLKILHDYCANTIEPAPSIADARTTQFLQKSVSASKPSIIKATQTSSLPKTKKIRHEHPPPTMSSDVEADQALLEIGFGFQQES